MVVEGSMRVGTDMVSTRRVVSLSDGWTIIMGQRVAVRKGSRSALPAHTLHDKDNPVDLK